MTRTCLVIRELHRAEHEVVDRAPALARRTLRAMAASGAGSIDVVTTVAALPEALRREVESVATLHDIDWTGDAALDAYPCDAMRASMAIDRTLRRLHADARYVRIILPAAGAQGYFALRAARSLNAYAGATFALLLHSPIVVRRFLDRRLTATTEQAFADHAEWSAIAEADELLAQGGDQFAALDAAGDDAGWLEQIRRPRRVITGVAINPAMVDPVAPVSVFGRPSVLAFGPLRYSCGAHTLVSAAQRLLASGVDVDVRFVGADLAEASFDRVMSTWLARRIGSAWADRFHFEPAPTPGSTGFAGADAGGIGAALERGPAVVCFAGADAGCAASAAEALAAGACVVAGEGSPAADLIDHDCTGLVVHQDDADALASALARVLTDSGLARNLGEAARASAGEKFSLAGPGATLRGSGQESGAAARSPSAGPLPAIASSPRVTVVIPFYNLGTWLPDTLRSVKAQTYTNYEVLVVDDGSTDAASLALLDHLPEQGIRVVRRVNGGLAAARNTGVREARTELVLTLDADDLLDPRYLETTVGVFERDRTGRLAVVSTPIKLFRESPDRPISGWIPLGLDRELLPFINVGAAASCLMRRDAVLSVGGYDEFLVSYEDWDLWCSLAGAGFTAQIVPEFLFHYRVRDDGVFRQFCVPNHYRYKSYLLSKHAGLATRPALAARLALGETKSHADRADWLAGELDAARTRAGALEHELGSVRAGSVTFEQAVERLRRENIRYRVADTINAAVKASGLHAPAKSVARRITGGGGPAGAG